jgi:hypothetical protein
MNRLVIIRVGEPTLWQTLHSTGRWSSPENHCQAVRNLMVEGYSVIALFVSRGDLPIGAARVTCIRERLIEDNMFPIRSDLGNLRSFLEFDPSSLLNLENGFTVTHHSALQYIRYQIGSQIAIPPTFARDFLNYFLVTMSTQGYNGNTTYLVPESLQGYQENHVNFII